MSKIFLYLLLSDQPNILFTVSYACDILLSFWNLISVNMYLVKVVTLATIKKIAVASYFLK